MNHCAGGPATDQFDMLSALVGWVEQGQAPASVIATRARRRHRRASTPKCRPAGRPRRTRPLCPYPQVARYTGGDTERAASFACRVALEHDPR